MPRPDDRLSEIGRGDFAEERVADAALHYDAEQRRHLEFEALVETASAFAPHGTWLDVGCGTGLLITLAQHRGIEIEGIELTRDRLAFARERTNAVIYDHPLETLDLPANSFAAVVLVNVFSHLMSPHTTLSTIHRILKPGGVLLLETGEIGAGVRRRHNYAWSLGDHLFFLGDSTIDWYAARLGYEVLHRNRLWTPAQLFTTQRFQTKGRSKLRNAAKTAIVTTPGALPLVRWFALNVPHADNPIYTSTILLRKSPGLSASA